MSGSRFKHGSDKKKSPAQFEGKGKPIKDKCIYCGGFEGLGQSMFYVGYKEPFTPIHRKCWEIWYPKVKSGEEPAMDGTQARLL